MIFEGVGNLNLESPQLTIGHAGKKEVARGGKNAAGRTDRNYNVNDSCSWAETPVGEFVETTKLMILFTISRREKQRESYNKESACSGCLVNAHR